MRSRISWLWCSLSGRCCCKEILSLRASNRDVIPRASKHNGVWASNQGRPMDSSGLHRLTWKDRSKPRASAAFCRYGLVSVCGNWRRKRLFGFLSALVGFRQCPELTREATTTSVFLTNTQSGDRGQTTSFHNTDVERGRAPGFIGVQAYYGASRSIMRANGIAIARREMGPQSSQLNCGARCHTGSTALGRQPCRRPLPLPKALRFAATEPQIFSDSARRSASSRRAGKT